MVALLSVGIRWLGGLPVAVHLATLDVFGCGGVEGHAYSRRVRNPHARRTVVKHFAPGQESEIHRVTYRERECMMCPGQDQRRAGIKLGTRSGTSLRYDGGDAGSRAGLLR